MVSVAAVRDNAGAGRFASRIPCTPWRKA